MYTPRAAFGHALWSLIYAIYLPPIMHILKDSLAGPEDQTTAQPLSWPRVHVSVNSAS